MDLWHPLEIGMTLPQALADIFPIVTERQAGIDREHLIDDYALSRNIARYGLKFKTVYDLMKESDDKGVYFWHTHRKTLSEKVSEIRAGIVAAKLNTLEEYQYRACKGFRLDSWLREYGTDRADRPIEGLCVANGKYEKATP